MSSALRPKAYKRSVSQTQRRQNSLRQYRRPVSVPKAIALRGTPGGYYEIPVTNVFKVFWDTSTGFWRTNQTTGAKIGVNGYRGFQLSTSLSDVQMTLGEGASTDSIVQSVPGFTNLQATFDMCKIAKIHVEVYSMSDGGSPGSSNDTPGAMFYMACDYNDVIPPANVAAILQYSDVECNSICNQRMVSKKSFTPYIVLDANNIGDTSNVTSVNQPATYIRCDNPGVAHRGIIGWVDAAQASGTTRGAYVYIKITQIRRYKVNK